MTQQGWYKLLRLQRLTNNNKKKQPSSSSKKTLEESIANASLEKEIRGTKRSMFVGFCVFCIGIAFFWLFCNSLHITSTDWIGGVQGLIHALTVMEICLFPLLFLMLKDAYENWKRSKQLTTFSEQLRKGQLTKENINVETFGWIHGSWAPFWSNAVSGFITSEDAQKEDKLVEEEVSKIKSTVEKLLPSKDASDEKKMILQNMSDIADRLDDEAHSAKYETYRELMYFFFNGVAFYGYLMGVLVFYFDDEDVQPSHVRSLKFGYSNQDADWHGNFAGDLMWTLEPFVILGGPMVIQYMKPKTKVKIE